MTPSQLIIIGVSLWLLAIVNGQPANDAQQADEARLEQTPDQSWMAPEFAEPINDTERLIQEIWYNCTAEAEKRQKQQNSRTMIQNEQTRVRRRVRLVCVDGLYKLHNLRRWNDQTFGKRRFGYPAG